MSDIQNSHKMPLLEHLIELRNRLMKSVIAIILLFFIFFAFKEHLYAFLVQPLANILAEQGGNRRMIFTALHEAFFTYIKVSFWTALFVAFPFVASQFWRFVAPGLYANEKKALLPYLILSPILFFSWWSISLLFYISISVAIFYKF